jgi:dihydrofolate synthase/folylpolyglutamate synthase
VLEWRLITSKRKVDIAIIEVGMVALRRNKHHHPLVSVITNIGLDHTQFLIEAIAGEKAGITKLNVPVVIGEYTPETKAVLQLKPQKKAQPSILLQN